MNGPDEPVSRAVCAWVPPWHRCPVPPPAPLSPCGIRLPTHRPSAVQNTNHQIVATTNTFNENTLDLFVKLMAPHIPLDDVISNVCFKRMSRMSNTIMVLDDDMMVLKQMEHILRGFGTVVTLQDDQQLYEEYLQEWQFLYHQ